MAAVGLVLQLFLYSEQSHTVLTAASQAEMQVNFWTDVASKSPVKPRVRINLGRSYQLAGLRGEAMREYVAAYDLSFLPGLDPYFASVARLLAYTNAGDLLIQSGQMEDAYRLLGEAWSQFEGFPPLAMNYTYILISKAVREQDWTYIDLAIGALDATIARPMYQGYTYEDRSGLWQNRSEAYRQKGDCDEASRSWAMASSIDPKLTHEFSCN